MCAAAATRECNRANASARFISRLRCAWDLMTITPVRVTRWSPQRKRRSLRSSGREERRMSKRRCTASDTLLTFWPPAPCARTALISTSDSGTITPIGRGLSPGRWKRFSAVVLEDRRCRADAGAAGVGNRVGRPIAVDARTLHREVGRARRARFRRLALRPVLTAVGAHFARRGHGILVRLHVLGRKRPGREHCHYKQAAFHRILQMKRAGEGPLFLSANEGQR